MGHKRNSELYDGQHLRLTFEVFHDVQKPIIYVGLLMKLDLHLVEVAQGILSTCRQCWSLK